MLQLSPPGSLGFRCRPAIIGPEKGLSEKSKMREEFLGRLSLPRVNGLAAAILFLGTGIGEATQRAPQTINFSRDIYPIFERSCHSCHGPEQQQGKLRLDSRQAALRGGQSGKIVLPGNSAESSLYQRVAGLNDLVRMPMGGELAADEIGLIRNWIDEGAEWPEAAGLAEGETPGQHWAFVAPKRPSLPQVRNEAWPANAIDYFILTRLEQEKLSPSPEADRIVLLRRLSLDLVGLPPSIEEVETFLADRRPDAYERQVERLLASPHYGERWGRHWLDAARYADSDGFEKDKPRRVWFYRDWVINALNRDLPYDDFIIQQLAGDLLPDAGQDQIVATGFLRNSMINAEGGIDPEQFRMEALFDRMDAIGKGILGITIQCAQCHDHKYDPLKQEEYYRLFAFLNNTHEANLAVYTPAEQMKRSEVFRRIREVEENLKHTHPDWKQKMARWEDRVRDEQPNWTVLRPTVEDISSGGQKYLPQADGSFLAQGYAPTKHRVKMTVETELRSLTAFRLELMNDPNLPLGGPGRSLKGTGVLTEFEVEAGATGSPEQLEKVEIAGATADIALPESPLEAMFDDKSDQLRVTGPIEFAIDGDEKTAWGIDAGPGRRNHPRKAVFTANTPITHPQGTLLRFHLSQRHGGANSDDNQNHNLGRFRISATTSPGATVDPLPAGLRETLEIPRLDRTPSQTQAVFSYWRTTVPEWGQANQSIEELWRQHPEGTAQLVLEERARRRETHLLNRGDFLSPGRPVSSGVPAFLHPFPQDAPPNRLGFARWLVDSGSPTTARSLVNRVWQAYFGIGLVASSENLGRQSEAPSHPRLLDWLAVEFMEQGWSLKQLHRLIVSSATYRQSSKQTRELRERDPYNRLLARGPRLRVEAEIVRDIALAASGLLNPSIGGASVYPPAPKFLFVPPASYGPKVWKDEKGENRYRRSLYTFRFRSVPFPMLQAFDAPNGDFSCVRRSRSNTPLQALTTLNEPLFLEAAQALALRTLREGGGSDSDRLTYAFRRCLTRVPSQAEKEELLNLLVRQRGRLEQGWVNPWYIAGFDQELRSTLPGDATPVQLAAWTTVARVLLNLDETITKE